MTRLVIFLLTFFAAASQITLAVEPAQRVAAAQAFHGGTSVQNIDFSTLRHRLFERGQILEWTDELAAQAKPRHKSGIATGEWASQEAWNEGKPGWEWLFPSIDSNKDGKISLSEHTAFQEYKKQYPDWQKLLKAEPKK